MRPAPGTWASAVAGLMVVPAMAWLDPGTLRLVLLAGVAAVTIIGVWAAPAAIRHFGVHDPSQVVIDEVAGSWLALACLPAHAFATPWLAAGVAVGLFRVFDIAKPWPVGWCERWPSGWGIMADDLAAGAIAGAIGAAILA